MWLGSRQSKWVRRALVALAVLIGVWLLGWLAVPPIAKSQIQQIASDKLGRQVTIGDVDFKPWTLEFRLDDLKHRPAWTAVSRNWKSGGSMQTPNCNPSCGWRR